jgi:hypothetical protein
MTTISAKTILRSRHWQNPDLILSTLLCRYPRWIHAEGRTHRLLDIGEDFEISIPTPSVMEDDNLSRNAASSRAIPVEKMIDSILNDPAVPVFWGKNEKGMQANEELPPHLIEQAKDIWGRAMHDAIAHARRISLLDPELNIGAHKQIVNRLLEPFMHITVLVSATEWNNFLALRDHKDAEPHIAMLAREIRRELDRADNIQDLQPGLWHAPFVTQPDPERLTSDDIKLSVACCASTSYKTVDGFDMTMERAIALHDRLVGSTPLHASPCEHVAQADRYMLGGSSAYQPKVSGWDHAGEHGNFTGFRQYRKMLKNEVVPG